MISSLHIIGSKGSGGAENFYCRLLLALQQQRHALIAVNPPGSSVARQLGQQVHQIHVGMRSVLDIFSRWRIQRLVRTLRPAIVQTYMGRATRLTHIRPGQGTVHVARLGGYYNLKGYRHAHAWVGNTRGICDYLVKNGLPSERVFHIGNFVEPAPLIATAELGALRQQLHIPDDALVIASVSRLHPNKGIDVLLDAFAQLPHTIADRPLHLLVVGDGPLRTQLQQPDQPRIHWVGWQQATAPYYQLADMFVCPSRHEPLGNVILEAWSHRRPVVATRTAGAEELISDEHNALLVPIENAHALAQGMHTLLADEHLRTRLAAAGSDTLAQQHSRDIVVQQYLDMYASLGTSACAE